MRKFIIALIAMALAVPAFAGDFEISGHVNTGFGYAKTDANYGALTTGAGTASPAAAVGAGALAEFNGGTALSATDHQFTFFVDEVEIDLEKEWGENFRARVDLGFGRAGSGSTGFQAVEQAFTTVNLPFGNGAEFLVGRFDAPMGFESNERNENTLASHGTIYSHLRPTSMTGVKFYYPFSDMVDLHFYVVNNLQDNAITDANNAPSAGFRLGFGWGDMDQRSTFGLSFAGGQEADVGTLAKDLTYLVDADWNVWLGDAFAIGGEALYRIDGAATGGTKGSYMAGQLNLHYAFSDVWDGTLRYGYASDKSGITAGIGPLLNATTTSKTQVHEIALGGQYHIADNAKLQMEFGYDMVKAGTTGKTYGGVFNFAYNF